jgi:hypothetical protein
VNLTHRLLPCRTVVSNNPESLSLHRPNGGYHDATAEFARPKDDTAETLWNLRKF